LPVYKEGSTCLVHAGLVLTGMRILWKGGGFGSRSLWLPVRHALIICDGDGAQQTSDMQADRGHALSMAGGRWQVHTQCTGQGAGASVLQPAPVVAMLVLWVCPWVCACVLARLQRLHASVSHPPPHTRLWAEAWHDVQRTQRVACATALGCAILRDGDSTGLLASASK
jgi:hypothetical protein